MTTHAHDHAIGAGDAPRQSITTDPPRPRADRPSWLLPGVAAAVVAIGLVAAGVVSPSTMLFISAFGGMMFMHLGGHGGHGAQAGHGAHGGDAGTRGEDLSERSGGSQPEGPGSVHGLDHRASKDPNRSETEEDDQHSSHGCH